MATNRSRRLRKKLCVDEFQELGCELTLSFHEGLSEEGADKFVDEFLLEGIDGNGLGYVGGDDYGFVCLAKAWLGQRGAACCPGSLAESSQGAERLHPQPADGRVNLPGESGQPEPEPFVLDEKARPWPGFLWPIQARPALARMAAWSTASICSGRR